MDFKPLKYIYLPTEDKQANTLLLLHGTGGNENDLISLGEQLGSGFNILSVRGNVLEHGMPRFFKRLGMGIFDEKDLIFRTGELLHFLKEVSVSENFNLQKIVALGYSNGANIAGAILVTNPEFLSGAILFRPMQPYQNLPAFKTVTNTPLFLSSGAFDPTVDAKASADYAKSLAEGGFSVSNHNLNTSHNLTQEDVALAKDWYHKNFGNGKL